MADAFGDGPFFLYVHFLDPHHPYMPPQKWNRFTQPYDGPDFVRRGFTGPIMWWLYQGAEDPRIDASGIQHLRDLHDGEIRSVDANIERLVDGLAQRGLRHKTLFVFTSDHGESILEHRHMGHGNSLYQTELHIPLIFHGPGVWGRAQVRSDLVCSTDVMPTILDLAGLPVPGDLDGASLFGGGAGDRPERSCLSVAGSFETMRLSMVSLRKGSAKVIYDRRSGAVEMYDLDADPGETKDVAGDERRAPDFAALETALRRELPAFEQQDGGSAGPIDPEVERALRALGYLR
jgi:arylsulfatase A-like enzyme